MNFLFYLLCVILIANPLSAAQEATKKPPQLSADLQFKEVHRYLLNNNTGIVYLGQSNLNPHRYYQVTQQIIDGKECFLGRILLFQSAQKPGFEKEISDPQEVEQLFLKLEKKFASQENSAYESDENKK